MTIRYPAKKSPDGVEAVGDRTDEHVVRGRYTVLQEGFDISINHGAILPNDVVHDYCDVYFFDAQESSSRLLEVITIEPANCRTGICKSFWIAKPIARSATMFSPRFCKGRDHARYFPESYCKNPGEPQLPTPYLRRVSTARTLIDRFVASDAREL